MRLSFLIAALAFAASTGLSVAQPFQGQSFIFGRPNVPQGPWCAHLNNSFDRVEEDCSFTSFAACNREARLSNGFCTQNFAGTVEPVRRRKGNRLRR